MNNENKNRLVEGLEVLLLFIGASIGLGASIGCFNYATMAKQAGDNEGFFVVVGIANLAFWVVNIIHRVKAMKKANATKGE